MSSHDELMETFTIFDDVFVPWERVFLCGEAEFAGEVANTFANVNRQGYLGADVGKLRLFIGAAQLVADAERRHRRAAHQVEDRRDDPARAVDLGARRDGRRTRAATRRASRCRTPC